MTLVQAIAAAVKVAMPTSEADTMVSVIHETHDYDKFEFLKSNRKPNDAHIARLVESMNEEYLLSPITVNENFGIIDGQHRFEAAKESGLPVRYIIADGYGVEQMKRFNINSSNWGKKEYLEHYLKEGYPEYLKFKLFMETYPDFSMSIALSIACDGSQSNKREVSGRTVQARPFDRGLLRIENYSQSTKVADALMQLKPHYPSFNTKGFTDVIRILLSDKDYRHSIMVKKFKMHKNNPDLVYKCAKQSQVWDMLKELYNFKTRRENRLYLPFDKYRK